MSIFNTARNILLTTVGFAWAIGWGGASGCAQEDAQQGGSQKERGQSEAWPPHGGQATEVKPFSFEVVYRPKEIRVYIYDAARSPKSAKDVKGEIAVQASDKKDTTHASLTYVATPADSGEQNYLTAAVDFSNVRDGDRTVTFKLENLPFPDSQSQKQPVSFSQNFVLSKVKLRVTEATVGEGDKAGIERQQVCPVTGEKLGSMGDPVKVYIDGQPVYLCCKGCLAKVKKDPETYLLKATQPQEKR
jgi:hypothetical protein